MTDNEIIKALECCTNCICNHAKTDTECPLVKMSFCKNYLMKESLALINRQKAEIERLHNEVKEKTETITFLENQATGWSIDFCDGTVTYTTSEGIDFLREVHLAPLADIPPDMMTVCERQNSDGKRYYVVKSGFMLSAVIMPCDVVDERMVAKMERISRLCKNELLKKNVSQEREE